MRVFLRKSRDDREFLTAHTHIHRKKSEKMTRKWFLGMGKSMERLGKGMGKGAGAGTGTGFLEGRAPLWCLETRPPPPHVTNAS